MSFMRESNDRWLCATKFWILALAVLATQMAVADDPKLDTSAQKEAPTAFAADKPAPVLNWGEGDGKSFLVPAYEIPGFELILNRFDHYAVDANVYESPISNFKANTHRKWVVDNDAFATNQFLHPYQGAFYQGLARSSGLDFWQSSAYTFAGSLLWEMAGETTRPSINDQVASGISGNFLGEPLFRMASLLLETSGGAEPRLWRKLAAAVISPSMGVNRLIYGKRFDGVFRSNDPAVFTRIDLGASLSTHFTSNVNVNADPSAPPTAQVYKRQTESALFTLSYGLPGKPDYSYERHVKWMSDWLVAQHVSGITLFCQDWGGLIGLRLVAAFPDRFKRVIVANTGQRRDYRRIKLRIVAVIDKDGVVRP